MLRAAKIGGGFDDGPERALCAAVVLQGIIDARRGSGEAAAWLDQVGIAWADALGIHPETFAGWRVAVSGRGFTLRRGKMTQRRMVLLDAESLNSVCPWHGEQPGAGYAPGKAPCGCVWEEDGRGRLWASGPPAQHEVAFSVSNSSEGQHT